MRPDSSRELGVAGAREGCQIEHLMPDCSRDWGSEGARETCKIERLRLDSSLELGSQGAREGCQIEHLMPDCSRDWGSEDAREVCKIERSRQDSSRELGFAGCTGRVLNRAFEAGFQSGSGGRMAHRKGAKSNAWGRILRVHGGACKIERLRPDSSRELGVARCAGSVQK